jgi:hypothetical protein
VNASREFVLAELRSVRDNLSLWIGELETGGVDGVNPNEIPTGHSVAELEGIPEEQLRSELAIMGQKLSVLAGTN